jgi:hypothetical protein
MVGNWWDISFNLVIIEWLNQAVSIEGLAIFLEHLYSRDSLSWVCSGIFGSGTRTQNPEQSGLSRSRSCEPIESAFKACRTVSIYDQQGQAGFSYYGHPAEFERSLISERSKAGMQIQATGKAYRPTTQTEQGANHSYRA